MNPVPNQGGLYNNNNEGVMLETEAISLRLSDDDIARAIGNRVTFARSWWNVEENLETVQKSAESIWLNLVSNDVDLYDYEEPYKENRIFLAIETLISQAVGNPPQPMVMEAYDTDASRDLAASIEKVLLAYYHNLYQHAQMEMVARHLLTGFRYAVVKYRWDGSIGRMKKDGTRSGGITTEVVRPDKIIFDAAATNKDDIPLIAEYMEASAEELCYRFPDKSNDIMQEIGNVSYGTTAKLTELTKYLETHFTGWRPDNGDEYEGIAWKLNTIVLDSMKNPNYNYDEFTEQTDEKGQPELVYNNFFDRPKKPYVVFNYLNQGKYIVDSTSLTEQTSALQRQLEQRGRQISVNASMANAGLILNSEMISEENAAKLIGDPDEKVMAKGDVQKAAQRLPQNTLPQFVIEDKADLRAAIDTLFGANAAINGEKTGSPTLGQDELSVQRNTSRLGTFVTCLENGWDRVYKGEIQLMKVFFDEPDMVKYVGPEGHTDFVNFSNQNIESGIGFKVQEGSLLPDDPATQLKIAQEFAPMLDVLSLVEYMGFDDPKKHAKMMWLSKADPAKYAEQYLGINVQGDHDPEAVSHIQQIAQGGQPTPPASPSNAYTSQMQSFANSPGFQQFNPVQKAQFQAHVNQTVQNGKNKLGALPGKAKPTVNPSMQNEGKKTPGILGRFAKGIKTALG